MSRCSPLLLASFLVSQPLVNQPANRGPRQWAPRPLLLPSSSSGPDGGRRGDTWYIRYASGESSTVCDTERERERERFSVCGTESMRFSVCHPERPAALTGEGARGGIPSEQLRNLRPFHRNGPSSRECALLPFPSPHPLGPRQTLPQAEVLLPGCFSFLIPPPKKKQSSFACPSPRGTGPASACN